jgi:hypothetical protein
MKKAALTGGLLLLASLAFASGSGEGKKFKTEITREGLAISAYSGREEVIIIIPGKIKNTPVTAIGGYAFAGKRIKSILLPDSIASVGEGAFADNPLNSITIGDDVRIEGDAAFPFGFLPYYNQNAKSSGTYILNTANGKWSFMPRVHIIWGEFDEERPTQY